MKLKLMTIVAIFALPVSLSANWFFYTFNDFKEDMVIEARKHNISEQTIKTVFPKIKYSKSVLKKDAYQPEFTKPFTEYYENMINDERVTTGQELKKKYKTLLKNVEKKYGIQPRFILAFWGLETNYGTNMGDYNVVDSLATLAYDGRRKKFFTSQFLTALKIIDNGHVTYEDMKGSWAGAMGHFQFMPTTFTHYAVDGDGDGIINIWGNIPDAIYSAANYLSSMNWIVDQKWGREVKIIPDFDWNAYELKERLSLQDWHRIGVRRMNGGKLDIEYGKQKKLSAELIFPAGYNGPAFLVYDNFYKTMRWNRSTNYALCVGRLADRIDQYPKIRGNWPTEKTHSRKEIENIQYKLIDLDFYKDEPDGIMGSKTQKAIQEFQIEYNLPADGYLSDATIKLINDLD